MSERVRVPGWFLGDGHMHTTFSDSKAIPMCPDDAKHYALKWGRDFTCFTDHLDMVQTHGWDVYLAAVMALGEKAPGGYVGIPGIEITAVDENGNATGDTLGFGLRSMPAVANRTRGAADVVKAIRESGKYASAAIAHPTGKLGNIPWRDMMVPGVRGIEVLSSGEKAEDYWRKQIATANQVNLASARAGSDAHGGALTGFLGTWVYCPDSSAEADPTTRVDMLSNALAAGRTAASEGGSLAFLSSGDVYPGGEVASLVGTKVPLGVYIYPSNYGCEARITWTLYRDEQPLYGPTNRVILPGQNATWDLTVDVIEGWHGYSLTVEIGFFQGDSEQGRETVYCGPLCVIGFQPGASK